MDEFNIYEELAPDPRPAMKWTGITTAVTNPDDVLKAITERISWYNKRANMPAIARIKGIKVQQLNDMAAKIKANPTVIKQQAAQYAEIQKRKEEEAKKELLRIGKLYVRNGQIADVLLRNLASKVGLSEDRVLEILNVTRKKPKTHTYKDDGVPELQAIKFKKIKDFLDLLHKRNIYEFLGVSPSAPLSQIQAAFRKVEQEISQGRSTISTNITLQHKDSLVKECQGIFNDDRGRKGYDKAADNEGFSTVRDAITQFKGGGMLIISNEQYNMMLGMCTKAGIPRDKAEYLIYTAAEKAGLDIDEGSSSDMVVCRFCGKWNPRISQACSDCGMPLSIVCPKCGKPTGEEDNSCPNCGFRIIDMRDAPGKVKSAYMFLNSGDLTNAANEYNAAVGLWPNYRELAELKKKITAKQSEQTDIESKVSKLCNDKKYYEAQTVARALAPNNPLRRKAEDGVAEAERLLSLAERAADANSKFDLYLQVLSTCSDCTKAKTKFDAMSLPMPTDLKAVVRGSKIELSWTPCRSSMLTYVVVRKEGAKPSGAKDGQELTTTQGSAYDDATAFAAKSYYYAVFSKFGAKTSAGAVLSMPVFIAPRIEASHIKVKPSEGELEFTFAIPGMSAMQVSRAGSSPRTVSAKTFTDAGLTTSRTYDYTFVAIFTDAAGQQHRSAPATMQFTPMPTPKPVDITVTDQGSKVRINWKAPAVGKLKIYYDNKPFKENKNEIISISAIKARSLSVVGTECYINKDFSGEMFFLPVTEQAGMGVVGQMKSFISLQEVNGVKAEIINGRVRISWDWTGCEAVRVSYVIDGTSSNCRDFNKSSGQGIWEVSIPDKSKNIRIEVRSIVQSNGRTLEGKIVERLLALTATKVVFDSITNIKKAFIFATNDYELSFTPNSALPCDLHLLVSEGIPPSNLVTYTPVATIRKNSAVVNQANKITFTYQRRNKSVPVFFRLIAGDRTMAKSLQVVGEIQQLK